MRSLVITTNSPGEVSGWVTPVLREFKRRFPESQVYVFVPPCQYASGLEKQVLGALPEVTAVYGFKELLKLIFLNRRPASLRLDKPAALLHLGGELFYSAMLASRLGVKAFACTNGFAAWQSHFEKFFVANDKMVAKLKKHGVAAGKIQNIGNLFYEAARQTPAKDELKTSLGFEATAEIVGLFPGSKPYQIKYILPFFLAVAEEVAASFPATRFVVSKSPFTEWAVFAEALRLPANPVLTGVSGELTRNGAAGMITTDAGIKIPVLDAQGTAVMRLSEFFLALPGTNQMEGAALGVPSLMVAPLNKPEAIPLDGVINYLDRIPLVGKPLKRKLVLSASAKMPFASLPNRLARREIVPEMRGVLTPELVAAKVKELLANPENIQHMSEELIELTHQERQPSALLLDAVQQSLELEGEK